MSESGYKKPDFIRSESERLYTPENLSISTTSLDDKTADFQRDGLTDHRRRRKCRNRKKERLNTQLLDAAQTADLEKCRRLLEEGADVNAECRDSGATALMVSAAWGNEDLVSFLLDKGASPIIRDKNGLTPAHVAAARGNEDVLHVLLNWKDADHLINAQVETDDHGDDYHKCSDSWIHQHETLLPNMPQLTIGSTPLHAASQWSHSSCVKLLLDKGADTEICDSRGLTPLDVAGEIVHRPDDCPHHEEGTMSPYSNDDLPSRQKASAFVPIAFSESINEDDVSDKKPSTRHVIEEIEAFRKRLNIEDIRRKPSIPFIEPTPEIITPQPITPTPKSISFPKPGEGERVAIEQVRIGIPEPTRVVIGLPGPIPGGIGLPGPVPENVNPLIPMRNNIVEPKDKKTKRSSRIKKIKNCLHTAVKEGDENLIRYLVCEKSHYIFQTDENGCTPAHIAVEMMDLKILSILLNKSEAVNVQDSEGRSLLYRSAELDWVNGVDFLLNANVDITTKANDGSTVLHVAARKNNSDLLEELFTFDDAKRVINEFDKKQQTPLCCAVEESSIPCVEFLLDHEACPTVVQQGELTLLHIAAKKGCKEIMELLLKSSANILLDKFSATSEGGMTPLHVSSKEGHVDCVELLVNRGANIFNKTTTQGKPYYCATPLHLAARYGRLEVAEVLIKFDKDVLYKRNSDLWQPLHVAARFGKTELVRLLLKLGGNLASEITLCDGYRKTALDMVVSFIPQPVEFLQDVFDSFICSNDYPLTHVDCIITFKYDLFSPSREENRKQLPVLDAVINSPKIILQEILLLHPLAETFLFLKWEKLRVFFFLIFAVYCVLTLSITTMSLMICTDVLNFMPSNLHFYRCTTVIPLVFLAIQEIFQASRLQRYYWTELESWVKWATFVLAGWLSLPEFRFNQGKPVCFTNISSVAVLLSWVELLLLLSRLPNWGFSVLMFCRVAQNVLKVLATFAILFIGFMFSLIIEFRSQSPFQNIWQSFTKVIVMTSEIEYSDMFATPAESGFLWSIVARSILLSFVILITIVLMNLMVGIAVNDITLLEAQGRTRRLAKQVSFLSLIEMFVYNGYLLKIFPRCLKNAIKKRRKVPLNLALRIGKPHKHDMKIFPVALRNSIMEKVSNIKKTDDKNDLKDLNDKIDKLIKQQKEQIGGSLSSLSTDDTVKHRNVTLSMLKQVAFSLQEVKTELNKLKSNFEPRRSFKTPKRKDSLMRT